MTPTPRPLVIDQRQRGALEPWTRMTDTQREQAEAPWSDHDPDGSRFFRGLCWAAALTGFGFGALMALFYLAVLVVYPLVLLLRGLVA